MPCVMLDTTGPISQAVAVGSSQLLTSGNIAGFGTFTFTPSGQAAVVPLETRNASSYVLSFDNTGSLETGVAIANLVSAAASVGVVIRDDTGAQISTPGATISLAGYGHTSFMLNDPILGFPVTVNIRGTIEFDTPQGGQISVLGLRANGNALTSLPVLANVGTGGGTMAHVASGEAGRPHLFHACEYWDRSGKCDAELLRRRRRRSLAASELSADQHRGNGAVG